MHDAWPLLAPDAAEIVDVMKQRVHQRAGVMSCRRMDDHPRRLVDDDEVGVLVEDRQRQRFRLGRRLRELRDINDDLLAGLHRLVRLAAAHADPDVTLLDQALNLRAGISGQYSRQKPIETVSLIFVRHVKRAAGHAAFFGFRFRSGTGSLALRDR
jgi:hypothetical protein